MLDPRIIVRGSATTGRGLHAAAAIRAGETVWLRDPGAREVLTSEIDAWPAERREAFLRRAYQTGADRFTGPAPDEADDPASYMNHSCDPSAWFAGDACMVARRDLAPGDEITYDYATSESAPELEMACACGAAVCRGVVRGTDLDRHPELRERYAGHLMAHLERPRP